MSLSLILFTGSAQFVFAELYTAQPAVLIGTIFLLNFRHFLYSTAFVPYARRLSTPARFLIGAQLTDESFRPCHRRFARPDRKSKMDDCIKHERLFVLGFCQHIGASSAASQCGKMVGHRVCSGRNVCRSFGVFDSSRDKTRRHRHGRRHRRHRHGGGLNFGMNTRQYSCRRRHRREHRGCRFHATIRPSLKDFKN